MNKHPKWTEVRKTYERIARVSDACAMGFAAVLFPYALDDLIAATTNHLSESDKTFPSAGTDPDGKPMSSDDRCACGHKRSLHIYHEGACRPGYACTQGCTAFRRAPQAPDDVSDGRCSEPWVAPNAEGEMCDHYCHRGKGHPGPHVCSVCEATSADTVARVAESYEPRCEADNQVWCEYQKAHDGPHSFEVATDSAGDSS